MNGREKIVGREGATERLMQAFWCRYRLIQPLSCAAPAYLLKAKEQLFQFRKKKKKSTPSIMPKLLTIKDKAAQLKFKISSWLLSSTPLLFHIVSEHFFTFFSY